MNADHLIDYALGKLDPPHCDVVDSTLRSDPEAKARVERLGRAIHVLVEDGYSPEPPSDLALRTLALVAQSRTHRSFLDYVPVRLPFGWADFAVAASIFIAGALTLLPAIQGSRAKMLQTGCVFNLQQIGRSLAQYASLHPVYPYPPDHPTETHTGTFAALLHDEGLLDDLTVMDCPYNGPCTFRSRELPSFDQVKRIRSSDPERYRRLMCWDYAYNVGYRHPTGRTGPLESRVPFAVPVVADQPGHDGHGILDGNSPNHHRRGQNVLFSDGSIRWMNTRWVSPSDNDIYLNNEHMIQPGVHQRDAVLMPSKMPFGGLLGR